MGKLKRCMKHLTAGRWQVECCFPAPVMRSVEKAIRQSERSHLGELRFAVEAGLEWHDLLRGVSSRARAAEVFSQSRIWDTEHNCGVLIYLLLAERKVEIVADRGIHARVGSAGWEAICRRMEQHFRAGGFETGLLQGIAAITLLLQQHFPATHENPNELPDVPIVL